MGFLQNWPAMGGLFNRQHQPPAPRALPETPARRAEQLAALADIADQGTALQEQADAAIRACGVDGEVPDEVAADLGGLLRAYSWIYQEVRTMQVVESLAPVRQELLGLISYHLHMLRDAGDLVFSATLPPENERFRKELALGLGSHAAELGRLRDWLVCAS